MHISVYLEWDNVHTVNACHAFPERMNKDVKLRTHHTQNCFIIHLPVGFLFLKNIHA